MSFRLHLNKLLDVDIHFTDGQNSEETILVSKGNQIHVTLLYFAALYGLIFTAVSYLQGYHYQALLCFLCFVFAAVAWVVHYYGHLMLSKFINFIQLTVIIALMFYFPSNPYGVHDNDSVLAFYVPVCVGTIIAFQGKESKYGYLLAALIILVMIVLISTDVHFPEPFTGKANPGTNYDMLFNSVGATVATFAEIAYIVALNNRLNRSLIKANQELDNFVYIVSHDLRSPLLSTSGLLELAKMRIAERDQVLKYLNLAGKSIGNLDDIIREILAYSRNSRTELQPVEFDLKAMVTEICEGLQYNSGNISFIEDFNGNSLIYCDKGRLHTVLRNVISNAVKYRKRNIEDPWVKISFNCTGTRYTIRVEDNGEGIPKESQARVFEMFYRGTASAQGTGLGLYICKEILEKMGAEFKLESSAGEGTSFTLSMERDRQQASNA